MKTTSHNRNERRAGEPAPRRDRRRMYRRNANGTKIDINKSSRGFRMYMQHVSQDFNVSKFHDTNPTNRKTKRRNGGAKLKKFGDKQRKLYNIIVNEVSAAYPVYASGIQPAHDFLRMYTSTNRSHYSDFLSAFVEHTYNTTRVYGWHVNQQVKIPIITWSSNNC